MVKAASLHQPKFIAIVGSPVPMVIGTDFDGIAYEEEATGIPTFGFSTTSLGFDKGLGSLCKARQKILPGEMATRPVPSISWVPPFRFLCRTHYSLCGTSLKEGYRVIASCHGLYAGRDRP